MAVQLFGGESSTLPKACFVAVPIDPSLTYGVLVADVVADSLVFRFASLFGLESIFDAFHAQWLKRFPAAMCGFLFCILHHLHFGQAVVALQAFWLESSTLPKAAFIAKPIDKSSTLAEL